MFRYNDGDRERLEVLAPVDGDTFDWDLLRAHVRAGEWPAFEPTAGAKTAVMDWRSNHQLLQTADGLTMRLSAEPLAPGAFGGSGKDRSVTLLGVRDADL